MIYRFFIVVFSFLSVYVLSVSFKNANIVQVVVTMDVFNSKNYNQVSQALNNIGGVRVKFYCETTNTAVLTVNRDLQPTDQNIIIALQAVSELPASVQTLSITPVDVINNCTMTTVIYPDNDGIGETDSNSND